MCSTSLEPGSLDLNLGKPFSFNITCLSQSSLPVVQLFLGQVVFPRRSYTPQALLPRAGLSVWLCNIQTLLSGDFVPPSFSLTTKTQILAIISGKSMFCLHIPPYMSYNNHGTNRLNAEQMLPVARGERLRAWTCRQMPHKH